MGRYNARNARPRPIVVKFTFYKDRELVRLSAPTMLSGTSFGISEQYPIEIEEKRRPLYQIAKKARENTENKVKLVRDKLYINGELFKPQTINDSENSTDTHLERNTHKFQPTNKSYKQRDATIDIDTREHSLTRRSRVFTRRATNVPTAEKSSVGIATSNRYAALGDNPPTPQSVRPTRVEKKKATSPLESVTTFKKQYLGGSSSRVGNDSVIADVEIMHPAENIQLSPRPVENNSTVQVLDSQSPSSSSNMTLQPSPVITMPTVSHDDPIQSSQNENPRESVGTQSYDSDTA